jgi:hypothetical protein
VRVSPHARRRFHDLCAGNGTIRSIAEVFEAEGVMPDESYVGSDTGQRRHEAARHEASLDLGSDVDNARLVRVYVEAVHEFGLESDGELAQPAKALVNALRRDGAPLDEKGQLTAPLPAVTAATMDLSDYSRLSAPEVVSAHLDRINAGARDDPPATIASCKELLESSCKFILEDYEVVYSGKDDLLSLYKKTAEALKLNAESVPESAKGSQAAQRALRSMSTVVQSVAELRNELGLGHGRTAKSPALARHARLTAALTTGIVQFLFDTWHVRRDGDE